MSPTQVATLANILTGNIGAVPPGVVPVQPPSGKEPIDLSLAFNDDIPISPVLPASDTGLSDFPARVDHGHEGLHGLSKLGLAALFGDVTLSTEGLITLAQLGHNLHFTLTLADILSHVVHEHYLLLANFGHTFRLLYPPLGEVLVFFSGFRKQPGLHYDQTGQFITLSNDVSFIDQDEVSFSYWKNVEIGS